jgi:hypothetical protein
MASRFRPSRSFAPKAAKRPARPLTSAPLPGTVIDALLRYHDEAQDQGCGRTLLRFSARRLRDAEVQAALGDHAARAAGVSILWNEREEEIIRVFEAADARLAA